jgi:hypothetical protein
MDQRSSAKGVRNLVLATVTIAALACGASSITGSGASPNGQVAWRVQNERVDLTNTSSQSVRYAIVGRTWMHNALADWCFGMPFCGAPLAASATATVAYSEISGGDLPEREAVVVWWTPNGSASVGFDTALVRIR